MKQKKGFSKMLSENVGFWFVLPWLIGFLCFKVYPFASSLYYSFTNYDLFSGISKFGLMNYETIFTDEDIMKAFQVTFKYAIFDVPLKLAFALFIAYILNFIFRRFLAVLLPLQFCGELCLTQTALSTL